MIIHPNSLQRINVKVWECDELIDYLNCIYRISMWFVACVARYHLQSYEVTSYFTCIIDAIQLQCQGQIQGQHEGRHCEFWSSTPPEYAKFRKMCPSGTGLMRMIYFLETNNVVWSGFFLSYVLFLLTLRLLTISPRIAWTSPNVISDSFVTFSYFTFWYSLFILQQCHILNINDLH